MDNFNNPSLNQAVAEDQLLSLSFISARINKASFPQKLGNLSTTDRYALYVTAKAPAKSRRPEGRRLMDSAAGDDAPMLTGELGIGRDRPRQREIEFVFEG